MNFLLILPTIRYHMTNKWIAVLYLFVKVDLNKNQERLFSIFNLYNFPLPPIKLCIGSTQRLVRYGLAIFSIVKTAHTAKAECLFSSHLPVILNTRWSTENPIHFDICETRRWLSNVVNTREFSWDIRPISWHYTTHWRLLFFSYVIDLFKFQNSPRSANHRFSHFVLHLYTFCEYHILCKKKKHTKLLFFPMIKSIQTILLQITLTY